jgi:general stress protein 26
MTGCSDIDSVWDIAESIETCMLTTVASGQLRSRPMHAVPDRDQGCLWFITDQRGAKDEEIRAEPEVCLAFADVRLNTYLSMTGRAEVLRDSSKARDLWSAEAQAWWPKGPADPDVRVLHVTPETAEYWDTRGNSIVVALKLAAARLSSNPPDLGENKKVLLR